MGPGASDEYENEAPRGGWPPPEDGCGTINAGGRGNEGASITDGCPGDSLVKLSEEKAVNELSALLNDEIERDVCGGDEEEVEIIELAVRSDLLLECGICNCDDEEERRVSAM